MTEKKVRKETLHVHLEVAQLEALRALSKETRVPIGVLVRFAITRYIDFIEEQRPATTKLLAADE